MKLRKHLRHQRLESLCQLGVDRVVDFQFGILYSTVHVLMYSTRTYCIKVNASAAIKSNILIVLHRFHFYIHFHFRFW